MHDLGTSYSMTSNANRPTSSTSSRGCQRVPGSDKRRSCRNSTAFDAAMTHSLGVRQTHYRGPGRGNARLARAAAAESPGAERPHGLAIEDEPAAGGVVRHLVLNRPEKLNALDQDQHARIAAAVEAGSADGEVRVICLSGRGRAFCAGDDLGAGAAEGPDPLAGRRVDLDLGTGPALLLESAGLLRHCPKPTVVLLHGHALGSGYDYSLSCDFRLATADVNYGDPRIHRALWAAEGWSYKLPRLLNFPVTPIGLSRETMDGQRPCPGLYIGVPRHRPRQAPRLPENWRRSMEAYAATSGSAPASTRLRQRPALC